MSQAATTSGVRPEHNTSGLPPAVTIAARTLAVDRVSAEVVAAFDAAGVPSLLMKGPVVAAWLYPEGGRLYGDTDVLVPPEHFVAAQSVLLALGFSDLYKGFAAVERADHASTFVRLRPPDAAPRCVDLHRGLRRVAAPGSRVWEELSRQADRLAVGGYPVAIPALAGRAMHVAFHAAQHGVDVAQPIEDLRRALTRLTLGQWRSAAELSANLGAEDIVATGLRLVPEGAVVADQLGLTTSIRPAVRLDAAPSVRGAQTLGAALTAPSARARLAIATRAFMPSTPSLRLRFRVARRGRMGLIRTHLGHKTRVLRHLGPAAAAWRRVNRASST